MSKAVLISIQPKWCEKIANGEKTVEVRKTQPKLKTPFKCYIYCTKPRFPHEDHITLFDKQRCFYAGGKVIGEFVCDRILDCRDVPIEPTCLTVDDWLKYTDGHKGPVYGWHISDLQIYEKPRHLFDFYKRGALSIDELSDREELCGYCSDTGYGEYATYGTPNGPVMCEGSFCGKAYQEYLDENFTLSRPPQSWCYVEELPEGDKGNA